ncbi:MAG: energy transducer TonB [Ignavibacteria bacterium]|nr:energy transducer TonB [Ignavibacteria bacterium]
MKAKSETIQGWAGSLIIHAILIVILLILTVPEIVPKDEFIELSWGATAAVASQTAPQASATPDRAQIVASSANRPSGAAVSSQRVMLPDRRIPDPSSDVLRVPKSEKLETAERISGTQKLDAVGVGEREQLASRTLGERESRGVSDPRSGIPSDVAGAGSGALTGDIDTGVLYSIQWMEGGTRRKISGELPKYPPGVNVEAQVKILTTVQPDGTVKSVQPAQKANTRLEDAAMTEIRHWRFESLRPSLPQVDQTCVITFLFKLR